tara:strand:+ start:737 stop:1060 length:324 start_codon:yes stop_codon:yes gene_type:complete
MPKKACLVQGALNYGEDINGNFIGGEEGVINDSNICEFGTGMDVDEEYLGEELGTDYTTHEEATIRGATPTTDRERNRGAYHSRNTEKANATLIFGGLVLYYLFGGF